MNTLFRIIAWFTVVGGAISAIVYYTYADVWTVPIDDPRLLVSIEPTLRGQDIVLVARHDPPSVGNLARCVDPDEPRRWVVGRVIGMSGNEVHLAGAGFTVAGSRETHDTACDNQTLSDPATGNDVPLVCRYSEFAGISYQVLTRSGGDSDHPQDIKVPGGKVFLMSDNRSMHLDSRDFGPLPADSCRHVLFRLWGGTGFTDSTRRFTIIW